MKDICTGCSEKLFVVEYIDNEVIKGNYCIDCMTCSSCGEVLPSERLAFMQVYTMKDGKSGMMSIPARECVECIRSGKEWKDSYVSK